jgi:hypothetical protein
MAGSLSAPGYFGLAPFEPPVVPQAARYGVVFLNARGEVLRTPMELLEGVVLVPIVSIRLEEGERT